MRSQLLWEPAPGPRVGVLVFPEAFGLGDHAIGRAERLAALGYIGLACDLHGGGRFVDDLPKAKGLLRALAARPEADAARVAATGFRFPMPLELARSGPT